jgi:hypothetical protein
MHCSCIASIVNGNKVSYCAFSICVLEEKERKRDVQRGPGRKAIFRTTAKDRKSIYVRSVWKLMICLQDRGTLSHLEPRLPAPLGPMMQVNFLRTQEAREASVLLGSCYNASMSTRHISKDVSNCFCRRSNSVCWTIVASFQLAISLLTLRSFHPLGPWLLEQQKGAAWKVQFSPCPGTTWVTAYRLSTRLLNISKDMQRRQKRELQGL